MYLFIDFETYSPKPITLGIRKYLEPEQTDVICGFFKLLDKERSQLDFCIVLPNSKKYETNREEQEKIAEIFTQTRYIIAHNIEFDLEVYLRILQKKYNFPEIPKNIRFICTAKRQRFFNQPASLKEAAEWYKLEQRKDTRGKFLIQTLSIPTKKGERTYDDVLEKEMADYCVQDVETLIELFFTQMEFSKNLCVKNNDYTVQELDLNINRTGFPVNVELAEKLTQVAQAQMSAAQLDACKLLDDFNAPSLTQNAALKVYIKQKFDYDVASFDEKVQTHDRAPETVRELIRLRSICNKNSLAKAIVVQESQVENRLHNQFVYCKAHTGRWAGRSFQPQNLPRTKDENSPETFLRQIISCGSKTTLIIMDYASIEHRALFYLAVKFMEHFEYNCENTKSHYAKFFTGEDTYIEFASKIYNVPASSIAKGSIGREVGKVGHLSLGYGTGAARFKEMLEQKKLNFEEEKCKKIVDLYRSTYSMIPKLWRYLIDKFFNVVQLNEDNEIELFAGLKLIYRQKINNGKNCLVLQLPSGRPIFYYDLKVEYKEGFGDFNKSLKIGNFYTHGGELVENLIQAFCRDLLSDDMLLLDTQLEKGRIVLHVHDEIVVESYDDTLDVNLKYVENLKKNKHNWCEDFPIDTEIFTSKYYRK